MNSSGTAAGDAARPRPAAGPTARGVRPERPLPGDLPAHTPRRGHRRPRKRGDALAEPFDERRRLRSGWMGEAGRAVHVDEPRRGAGLNVEGRRLSGAIQGFGPCGRRRTASGWRGASVTPAEVVAEWKRDYPAFWPDQLESPSRARRLEPGDVGLIKPVRAAAAVHRGDGMYADEESFAFALPEGHIFAGWITFSAFDDGGTTVAQVQPFFRTSDPLYDVIFRVYFDRKEDRDLAPHVACVGGTVRLTATSSRRHVHRPKPSGTGPRTSATTPESGRRWTKPPSGSDGSVRGRVKSATVRAMPSRRATRPAVLQNDLPRLPSPPLTCRLIQLLSSPPTISPASLGQRLTPLLLRPSAAPSWPPSSPPPGVRE